MSRRQIQTQSGMIAAMLLLTLPIAANAKEPRFDRGTTPQETFDADIAECRARAMNARDAAEARAEAQDDDTTGGIIGSGLGAMIGGGIAGKGEFRRCMRQKRYAKSRQSKL